MTASVSGKLRAVPMPSRVRALPRNKAGYPIPFFAATMPDGEREFRIMDAAAFTACLNSERLCWICGQRRPLGAAAFLVGPMCAVNRINAEPPSHIECAEYAAIACPFLSTPGMVRRTSGLPDNHGMAGHAILRNPGAVAVWLSKWTVFKTNDQRGTGRLVELGEPKTVTWWAHGRPATRAEVAESIESGLPLLEEACEQSPFPDDARRRLREQRDRAMRLLPEAVAV